MIRYIGLL